MTSLDARPREATPTTSKKVVGGNEWKDVSRRTGPRKGKPPPLRRKWWGVMNGKTSLDAPGRAKANPHHFEESGGG